MICSYYIVMAYDKYGDLIAAARAFSFDEAYYCVDRFREVYPETAVKFVIKYPDKDVYGKKEKTDD